MDPTPSVPAKSRPRRWLPLGMALLLLAGVPVARAARREHRAAQARVDRLARLPFTFGMFDDRQCERAAAREHAIIARLDMQGAMLFRTRAAVPLGEAGGPTLDQADALLPPWPARAEVRAAVGGNVTFGQYATADGSAEVLTLAQPVPEGGALYILTGSRRGVDWMKVLVGVAAGETGLALAWGLAFAVGRRGRADGERR